jgi:hypothetical protein
MQSALFASVHLVLARVDDPSVVCQIFPLTPEDRVWFFISTAPCSTGSFGSNPITDDRTIDPMHKLREVLAVTGYSPEHASLSRG